MIRINDFFPSNIYTNYSLAGSTWNEGLGISLEQRELQRSAPDITWPAMIYILLYIGIDHEDENGYLYYAPNDSLAYIQRSN